MIKSSPIRLYNYEEGGSPMPASKVGQIADALRQQILSGEYGKGRLPTGKDLAKQFGASRDTIQKVLTRLEAEGILEGVGERGAIIRRSRIRIPGLTARFDLALQEQGYDPFEENIDVPARVPALPEVAKSLAVKEGTPVIRRFRRQGTKDGEGKDTIKTPYRLTENFYPSTLVDETILEQMQKDERYDVLLAIKEKHDQAIVRVHEEVIGRLPTTHEEELLNIVTYAPVIEVQRTNYANNGTVIMFNKIIFVANYFVLSYDYPVSHWTK
jgi:GntR family transcriptional regulator